MRLRLAAISAGEALAAGEAALARLVDWPIWQRASTVALFSTLPGEIDTRPLIERARLEGKRISFPRIIENLTLEFVPVERDEQLRLVEHGLREPSADCRARPLSVDDLVLVPGLAFDREGGRLGRGAGYYDRALAGYAEASARPCFIGLAFTAQIVDSVPTESFDLKMDGVLTETEFTRRA